MKFKFTILLLLFCCYGFGQFNQYHYKSELLGIRDQWHKIILPDDIFGKISPDFSDIRIFGITENKDTIEAPYILQFATENTSLAEVPFKVINQSKNKKGYYYTFETPTENTLNQIYLDFKQLNFDWKLNLEGSQNQQDWFSIINDYRILSIKNENTNFQFTKVNFPNSKFRYFRLFIDSEKSPELLEAKLLLSNTTEGNYRKYTINSHTIDDDKQNKQTIIIIDLKSYAPISKLTLSLKSKYDYYRPITIKYLTDSVKTEKGWKYNFTSLTSGTLNSFEKNEFKFNSTILKKLKIVIENQDNQPLQIDSLVVEGYVHELIARFIAPASYFLTYGNNIAEKPHYDIDRFANKIPTTLTLLKLGSEQLIKKNILKKSQPLFENKIWLWAIMASIIILLGWFSLKMIRQK